MPLFHINKNKLNRAQLFDHKEKDIQTLIENNLEVVFNCKFIETEFSTGAEHSGRIDTLALSEDDNPVIIEYKKSASSDLINQSLYYLSWIKDHKGDFQVVANKKFGKSVKIEWDDIRVICIAPDYKKYDIHAVTVIGANIELWQYKLYNTNILYLEKIFPKSISPILVSMRATKIKNSVMVEAGKKAWETRKIISHTLEEHLSRCNKNIKKVLQNLRDFILNIDDGIKETPKKFYIGYKVSQNFIHIKTRKEKIILFLKLNPKKIQIPKNGRDMTNNSYYFSTGELELTIRNSQEMENSKEYIKMAFKNIGG